MSRSPAGRSSRPVVFGLACACAALVSPPRLPSAPVVEMQARPEVCRAPANIRVRVQVEPDQANRRLTVEADSGAFLRSSAIDLGGADAPRTHWITWSQMPPGDYRILAAVEDTDGRRAFAYDRVVVE